MLQYKRKASLPVGTALLVFSAAIAVNHVFYGTGNVFRCPKWLDYNGIHYFNTGEVTLFGDNKPSIDISRFIDKMTGKRLYSDSCEFRPCKTIYLRKGKNTYIRYDSLAGGF